MILDSRFLVHIKHIRRRFRHRPKKVEKPRYRVNDFITAPRVFVTIEDGEVLGEMDTARAKEIARENGLDLVEVAPTAQPPVCKILDYGKFQYAQAKLDRAKKANQKKVETKGVRIGLRTDTHDLEFKKAQTEKFLSKGHKVKIEIVLRGREKAHQDLARKDLKEFMGTISIPFKIEEDIKRFPGGFNLIITPQ